MTIKIDLLSFDEVLTKGAGFPKRHLLLGNGFSRALRNDIFSYDALFDRAEFSTLQNHGFSEKQKAFFDHSHLQLNRAFTKGTAWDEAAIQARGEMLFGFARAIWVSPAAA